MKKFTAFISKIKIQLLLSFCFLFSIQLVAQIEPDPTKFEERDFYTKIFSPADRQILAKADTLKKYAEIKKRKSIILFQEATQLKKAAEDQNFWKEKRTLAEAEAKEKEAYKLRLQALEEKEKANQMRYEIYQKRIVDVRLDASENKLKEGLKLEQQTAKNFDKADSLRSISRRFEMDKRLRTYAKADSLERKTLNNLEYVFGLYNDYVYSDLMRLIEQAKKNLDEVKVRFNEVKNNAFVYDEKWKEEVNAFHDKIERYRENYEKEKEGSSMKKYLKNQVLASDYRELALLDKVVEQRAEKNDSRFNTYLSRFSYFDPLTYPDTRYSGQNLIDYRLAQNLHQEIVYKFNEAKEKIHQAYSIRNRINEKVDSLELFELEEYLFRRDKYRVSILLLEAAISEKDAASKYSKIDAIYKDLGISKKKSKIKTSDVALGKKSPVEDKNEKTKKAEDETKKTTKTTKKKTNTRKKSSRQKGINYKVQIASFKKPQPKSGFNGLPESKISEEKAGDGWIAYLYGNYKTKNSAGQALEKARSAGYSDAFIVIYKNGKRQGYQAVTPEKTAKTAEVYYKIQFASLKTNEPVSKFSELPGKISKEKMQDDWFAYLCGNFTKEQLNENLQRVKNAGYTDAFIVKYKNGERIIPGINSKSIVSDKNIIFRVQIGAGDPVPSNTQKELYRKISPTGDFQRFYLDDENITVYTIGQYENLNEANQMKKLIVKKGIKDAFVVAFIDDKKITIEKALSEINKN